MASDGSPPGASLTASDHGADSTCAFAAKKDGTLAATDGVVCKGPPATGVDVSNLSRVFLDQVAESSFVLVDVTPQEKTMLSDGEYELCRFLGDDSICFTGTIAVGPQCSEPDMYGMGNTDNAATHQGSCVSFFQGNFSIRFQTPIEINC